MITLFDDFDFGKVELAEDTARKICEAYFIYMASGKINMPPANLTDKGFAKIYAANEVVNYLGEKSEAVQSFIQK